MEKVNACMDRCTDECTEYTYGKMLTIESSLKFMGVHCTILSITLNFIFENFCDKILRRIEPNEFILKEIILQ